MPSGIVTKPPKPGFVGFGITCLGDYQNFELNPVGHLLPDFWMMTWSELDLNGLQ